MLSRSSLLRLTAYALGVLLLAGCGRVLATGPSMAPGATATPYGQTTKPTPAVTPPPGWSAVLPGLQLINTSTRGGLVVSAAQAGRVIGCGMRTPVSQPATPPTFLLSDDGGKTWQTRAIPNLPPAQGCEVLADTLQPDTFATLPSTLGASVYFTRDAGMTWNALELPPSGRLIGLSGGQLLAVAGRSYGQPGSLLQASLAVGSWQVVAPTLPPAGSDPYAAAVDPDNPAIMYLSGFSGTTPAVYRTTDGGLSWQLARTLPWAHQIALYSAHQHQVFAAAANDLFDSARPLVYSADAGRTWQSVSMHDQGASELLCVSPQGHVITETGPVTSYVTLYALDPAHATFTPMGTYTLGPGPLLTAVVDGPTPALLYATPDHVWRLPLSA
jgi:BNR/Asp-box repeat protein